MPGPFADEQLAAYVSQLPPPSGGFDVAAMREGIAQRRTGLPEGDDLRDRLNTFDQKADAVRRQIAAALEEAQLRSRESLVALFAYLMAEIGLRLRDPAWTADHLQITGGLLVQALALRNLQVQAADGAFEAGAVDALLNAPVPGPGLNGQTAEWTLVSHAYAGLVDGFVELDPDFTPPAAG